MAGGNNALRNYSYDYKASNSNLDMVPEQIVW